MPVSTTWTINNMTHVDADGGVITVYWSCGSQNDSGPESCVDAGKLALTYDASSPSFIPYADLTENTVLGWVWDSLRVDDETSEQAKARIEARCVERVDEQIQRNATQATGVPWAS